jgi:hypothetical protein
MDHQETAGIERMLENLQPRVGIEKWNATGIFPDLTLFCTSWSERILTGKDS